MKLTKAIITGILALQGVAYSAPFLDDFETDTSANYTATVTFGSGGVQSFNVTGGMLNVLNDGNITYDVFHNTARLAIGETVSVDLLSGAQDVYLTISTTNRGPNTGSEDGIRLNWIGSMRARIYNDGSGENIVHADEVTPSSLYITRDTDTSYTYGYDSTELNTGVTIAGTAGIGMQIGIETYGSGTRVWDNLQIISDTSPDIAITEIDYAPDAEPDPTVTLTWRKSGAASYVAKRSSDLIDWEADFGDGITVEVDENPDDPDHITVTFPLSNGLENEPHLFFRIEGK